ncbi:hypothetical protein TNCV_3164011 [Trichonephila clavipes]|nr:hypothetical protein TNCV_3164011 [Trichonephila clavipes]
MEGVGDICVSANLSLKHAVIEAAGHFCHGGVFLEGRLVVAVQRTFYRHFNIPLRSRNHTDRKCALMQMDAIRETGNVSKERIFEDRKCGMSSCVLSDRSVTLIQLFFLPALQ